MPGPNLPPKKIPGPNLPGPNFPGPIFWGSIYQGPNLTGPDMPGPNLPGPNFPGPICWGSICQRPNLTGPNLPKKNKFGPKKMRRPICWQIGEGPNLPRTLTNKRNNQTNNAVEDPDNIKAKKPQYKSIQVVRHNVFHKSNNPHEKEPTSQFFRREHQFLPAGRKSVDPVRGKGIKYCATPFPTVFQIR